MAGQGHELFDMELWTMHTPGCFTIFQHQQDFWERSNFSTTLVEEASQKRSRFKSMETIIQDMRQNANACQVSYEDLYGHMYHFFEDKQREGMYRWLKAILTKHLTKVGADLLASAHGNFLVTLSEVWNAHHRCISKLNDIIVCLSRRFPGEKSAYDVSAVGKALFLAKVIPDGRVRDCLHATLLGALLGMASFEIVPRGEGKNDTLDLCMRHGGWQMMDRCTLKSICHMFQVLNLRPSCVYKDDFETPYVNKLREIYRAESQKLLDERGVSEYIKIITALMSKEDERAKICSDNSMKDAVITVMEEELIFKHLKTFFEMENSGVKYMIRANQIEDLECVCKLLLRVESGPKMMTESVSKCLIEEFKAIMARHNSAEDAVTFVQLFELKNRICDILQKSFQNNILFKREMEVDLKYVLNRDPESSKLIAAFIEKKLVKGLEKVKADVLTATVGRNDFLKILDQNWSDYYKNISLIQDVMSFMGDDYARQHHPDNIFQCRLAAFRDLVLYEVRSLVHVTLLNMLMRDRRGEVVDRLAIQSACDMFIILRTDSFDMYKDVFEDFFVKQSTEFYTLESEKYVKESGVAVYLKAVAGFIKSERERAKIYVGSSLAKALVCLMEEEFVSLHLTSIIEAQADLLASLDDHFLHALTQIWDNYFPTVVSIKDIIINEGRDFEWESNPDRIFEMGLEIFQNLVFTEGHVRDRLRATLVDMIMRDRRGEVVDRWAIKSSCKMLKVLGHRKNDFYEDYFETPFIEQSVTFNQTTNSGVVHMLKNGKFEDVQYMYKLFSRGPEGPRTMFEFVCGSLTEEDKALKLIPEKDTKPNAISFIQKLVDTWTLCNQFLKQSVGIHNRIFKHEFDNILENILNHNPKSAEYLSIFFDYKLSREEKEMTELDLENELDTAAVLFRFLREKDFFEHCYKRQLQKRLLLHKSISYDLEKFVISKFKIECGVQFSSNLEGMLQDMIISKSAMVDFNKGERKHTEKSGIDLSVSVLTTGIWPLQAASLELSIPVAAMSAFEAFRKFYLSRHSGRRLLLQTQLGSADLEATFYGNLDEVPPATSKAIHFPFSLKERKAMIDKRQASRKHILQVTTNQMCILMLFNTRKRLTYQEIRDETNIPSGKLVKELKSLALCQVSQTVLIKEPNVESIVPSDIFYVNEGFTSKLHRVKIQPPATPETKPERPKKIRIKLDKERIYQIEAAIVRVMKSKKKIHHNELLIEVTKQLQSRFLPDPIAIKNRIERLIERDYLAREADDRNLYKYIA